MHNRLIMFTGSSPGAGKSTLSELLFQRLTAHGIPSHWLSEGDLLRLDLFAQFDQEIFREDRNAIHTLLEGVQTLFADGSASYMTWITDALFPGFFWLLGRYPYKRVEAFSNDLARILFPLDPLIVYLNGDVATVFGRAATQRGTLWTGKFVAALSRWSLPYYSGPSLRDPGNIIQFFEWLNRHSLELIARWPGERLILDTAHIPVDDLNRLRQGRTP